MNNWIKLEELVSQNQFELLMDSADWKKKGDLRLVYLMNDAVESFLVFRHASVTGTYMEEFEGEIRVDCDAGMQEEKRKYLILHQEENVVTIFFEQLDFEVHLFDYSQVGHFWVDGYEYLRQLEFKIAILGDKYQYIGENACTEMEKKLALLCDFPPLSYCSYPAVPEKYIVPRKENPWIPSREAITIMKEIAAEAGDPAYGRWLSLYRYLPTKGMGKFLAGKLHQTRHIGITKMLMKYFTEGCKPYPARYARKEKESEDLFHKKIHEAKERLQELQEDRQDAELFIEEPFWFASDGLEGKVYLGIWEYGRRNTRIRIEEFPGH